jgi:hypothetical protein
VLAAKFFFGGSLFRGRKSKIEKSGSVQSKDNVKENIIRNNKIRRCKKKGSFKKRYIKLFCSRRSYKNNVWEYSLVHRVFPRSKRPNVLVVYIEKKRGGVQNLRHWLSLSINVSKILVRKVYIGVKSGWVTTTNIDVITDTLICL